MASTNLKARETRQQTKRAVAAAVAYLNAQPTGDGDGDEWIYAEKPGGPTYKVDEFDLASLGRGLVNSDAHPRETYSLWCAATHAEVVTTDGKEG